MILWECNVSLFHSIVCFCEVEKKGWGEGNVEKLQENTKKNFLVNFGIFFGSNEKEKKMGQEA